MLYAKQDRINYVWYVGYTVEDGKATIHLHDRLRIGLASAPHPETDDAEFGFIESPERVALKLVLKTKEYPAGYELIVANPMHVFDYGRF
jgi:hypothetical protein